MGTIAHQNLKEVKGSTTVFDSSDIPGLIPDLLVMKSDIVKSRPADVQKIVDAWYDAMDWWRKNPDAAIAIMAKRTDTPVADYKEFIGGTRLFSAPEALAALTKSDKVTSLYTSGASIAQFLVDVKQADKVADYAPAIEPKFVKAALAKGLGKLPPYDYKTKVMFAPTRPQSRAGLSTRFPPCRSVTLALLHLNSPFSFKKVPLWKEASFHRPL
jgi:hypothetical protein